MEKKLALAFEFKNAPQSFKDQADAHRKNYIRLEKAKMQLKKWQMEMAKATAEFNKSSKDFDRGLEAWERSLDTETPAEEMPVVVIP